MDLLGKKVKDVITEFEGIATSKHIYITGCNKYGVQPKVNDSGVAPDVKYFDESRLFVTGEGVLPKDVQGEEKGCDSREHPDRG